jgi:hypothetical protein
MIKYTKEKLEREMAWALHNNDYLGYHCVAVQLGMAREELEDEDSFDKGGEELERLIIQEEEK